MNYNLPHPAFFLTFCEFITQNPASRMCFLTKSFTGRSFNTSPNLQARGPPLVGCPRLLIQFICSYPPYRRRLRDEELNDLYSSPNILRVIKSRRMRWAGYVARMGEERGVYRVLVGKPEGKRPLGRPTRRWVDNIRMDLQEVVCGSMDWIGLAQDRDRWRTLEE